MNLRAVRAKTYTLNVVIMDGVLEVDGKFIQSKDEKIG